MKPRKMKDSGIPWIGEIPEGWEVKRLKTFAAINPQIELGPDEFHEDAQVSFIPMENLRAGFHAITPIDFSKVKTGYVSFANGDILMAKVTPCYENGTIAVARNLANGIGFGSTEILVFRTTNIDRQYLFYYLQNPAFKGKAISEMYGVAGLKRLTPSFFENSHYPYPTRSEQERIAAYLDEKCGEIDRVIAAKERQNELLRDQRAAVIHEAVTKGLNPKAKFKESGYEWIGKIPADWTLDKIKWLGKSIIGLTYSPEEVASDGTLVLRASNIQGGQVVYDDNVYVRKEIPDEIVLRKDDILICSRNGSRALIGKCALIDEKVAGQTFGAFMTVLRSPANRYLFHVLNSQLFSFYLSAFLTSTINQLTTENLNNMVVPMPKTPAEQQQIAAHLDARCGEIDRVMAANEGMVAKLKEYRASLIWEAVTGKKCL